MKLKISKQVDIPEVQKPFYSYKKCSLHDTKRQYIKISGLLGNVRTITDRRRKDVFTMNLFEDWGTFVVQVCGIKNLCPLIGPAVEIQTNHSEGFKKWRPIIGPRVQL